MDKLITGFSLSLLIWQIATILMVGLWVYCLIDILKNKFKQNDKLSWFLTVIFIPVLGSLLYLFFGKKKH